MVYGVMERAMQLYGTMSGRAMSLYSTIGGRAMGCMAS